MDGGASVIKSISLIRRKPGTTPEEFRNYYETVHAPLGQKYFKFARYVRNYPVRSPGQPEPPYDVVVEFWFADRAALDAALKFNASPEARIFREDEAKFMDTSSIAGFAVEESMLAATGGDSLT
jgi:uncharacterized protein (TIGR02118 family)